MFWKCSSSDNVRKVVSVKLSSNSRQRKVFSSRALNAVPFRKSKNRGLALDLSTTAEMFLGTEPGKDRKLGY